MLKITTDNECFKWAVLSALYPSSGDPRSTLKQYKKFEHKLNWSGLVFPLPLNQIRRFENNNPSLTVNVYIYKPEEGDAIIPVYLTKHQARSRHIDLLLLSDGPNTHYTWIKNMSRLCRAHINHSKHHKSFTCPHCVHKFTTKVAFENHFPDCSKHERQVIKFPELGKHILEWRSRNKTQLTSHIIYADFESYLSPVTHTDPPTSKTTVIDEHVPSGFCCYTVSQSSHYPNRLVSYSGENCMDHFFDHLMREQARIACIEGKNIEMLPLTRHQQEKFEKTEDCKNCGSPFTKKSRKCRHHNHSTGQFIAAVCNSCNLQLKARRQRIDDRKNFSDFKNATPTSDEDQSKFKFFIPVVFHNLSGYDSHHIFRYFNPRVAAKYSKNGEKKFPPNVEIIALNLERFISFDIFYLRFIDSVKFLSASLDSLVENLVSSCDQPFDKFTHTREHFNPKPEDEKLIFKKGEFPYNHFDSLERFKETSLPQKTLFTTL